MKRVIGMFKNLGAKLRVQAWIGFIIMIVSGVSTMITLFVAGYPFIGLLVFGLFFLSSWLVTMPFMAFAQITEDVEYIRDNMVTRSTIASSNPFSASTTNVAPKAVVSTTTSSQISSENNTVQKAVNTIGIAKYFDTLLNFNFTSDSVKFSWAKRNFDNLSEEDKAQAASLLPFIENNDISGFNAELLNINK